LKALIVLFNGDFNNLNLDNYDLVIACDRGAYILSKMNIHFDIAVGDFDSVNDTEFELIKNYAKEIIKLNPIKDDSDTLHAISLCNNYDEIIINGGIKGNRIEHFIANLLLIFSNNKIKMFDSNSFIELIDSNDYNVKLNYKFVSLFSLSDDTIISLSGFKYNLNNFNLKQYNPLGLSNEIINNPKIDLIKGKLIIIYTNE